jgi:hypothetical protein
MLSQQFSKLKLPDRIQSSLGDKWVRYSARRRLVTPRVGGEHVEYNVRGMGMRLVPRENTCQISTVFTYLALTAETEVRPYSLRPGITTQGYPFLSSAPIERRCQLANLGRLVRL